MRDQLHRILTFAGLGLLAGVVIFASPSLPGVFIPAHHPVRLAEATTVMSDVSPLPVGVHRGRARSSATAKPNPASCPGLNNSTLMPPVSGQPVEPLVNGPPRVSGSGGNTVAPASPCPEFGGESDAQTDIARGQALARPEPLNSKQLIPPPRR